MIIIPPSDLADETLRAIIESFVVREGTDYGDVETSLSAKVAEVSRQISRGEVLVVWDEVLESCNLITRTQWQRYLKEEGEA